MRIKTMLIVCGLLAAMVSCRPSSEGDSARPSKTEQPQSNRIDVPAAVRASLGIIYVPVERRSVAGTQRFPGAFERPAEAVQEYHALLSGAVELKVRQYDRVENGTPLAVLKSTEWHDLQEKIFEAESEEKEAKTVLETMEPLRVAHQTHEKSSAEQVALWEERVRQLEVIRSEGGGRSEELNQARIQLSMARAEFADVTEKDADLGAREAAAQAKAAIARAKFELHLGVAAALTGMSIAELTRRRDDGRPEWFALEHFVVRARAAGVVEETVISAGTWATQGALILRVVEPGRLRFRARAIQADVLNLVDGQNVNVVADQTATASVRAAGTLIRSLNGDAATRSVDLYVHLSDPVDFAYAGRLGVLEIQNTKASQVLAIPERALVRDGLESVLFRRDPADPDRVIRLTADLGASDGVFVEVKSGLTDGDEVVVEGAYQLMLSSSPVDRKGGHFHADGTYHEGEDH